MKAIFQCSNFSMVGIFNEIFFPMQTIFQCKQIFFKK